MNLLEIFKDDRCGCTEKILCIEMKRVVYHLALAERAGVWDEVQKFQELWRQHRKKALNLKNQMLIWPSREMMKEILEEFKEGEP